MKKNSIGRINSDGYIDEPGYAPAPASKYVPLAEPRPWGDDDRPAPISRVVMEEPRPWGNEPIHPQAPPKSQLYYAANPWLPASSEPAREVPHYAYQPTTFRPDDPWAPVAGPEAPSYASIGRPSTGPEEPRPQFDGHSSMAVGKARPGEAPVAPPPKAYSEIGRLDYEPYSEPREKMVYHSPPPGFGPKPKAKVVAAPSAAAPVPVKPKQAIPYYVAAPERDDAPLYTPAPNSSQEEPAYSKAPVASKAKKDKGKGKA